MCVYVCVFVCVCVTDGLDIVTNVAINMVYKCLKSFLNVSGFVLSILIPAFHQTSAKKHELQSKSLLFTSLQIFQETKPNFPLLFCFFLLKIRK
jgi:hypothetical protein